MAATTGLLALHDGFATIENAIKAVETHLKNNYHPLRRETKEFVKNFNKKCRKTDSMITDLQQEQQYSQR